VECQSRYCLSKFGGHLVLAAVFIALSAFESTYTSRYLFHGDVSYAMSIPY
jgi:hypothetical protein